MLLIFRMVGNLTGKKTCKIPQSVTLLILDSDRQGIYALYKDNFLNCFEIANISVLFMANLGGPGWKFEKLDLSNR